MAAAVRRRTRPDAVGPGNRVLEIRVRRHVVDAQLTLPLDGLPVTVLFGPSGAGKTTILRTLAGLDRSPDSRVVLGDQVWDDGGRRFVPTRHRRVGYLFQDHNLFPHLSVEANVTYGLSALPRRARAARAAEALTAVGAAHLAHRHPAALSGGEAQRVALARALAPDPQLLLLDEPLSALDAPTRAALRTELRRILVRAAVPTVVVTHDRAEALALGDRVVVLIDGRPHQMGPAAEVFDRPLDADVARAVGVETATPALVTAADGPLVRLDVAGTPLTALLTGSPGVVPEVGDAVVVCIRAEDVALELPGPERTSSPRNHLPGIVTAVAADGPVVRVDLDVGFGLAAYITRPALEDLGLRPGARVIAAVKSPAVHVITTQAPLA